MVASHCVSGGRLLFVRWNLLAAVWIFEWFDSTGLSKSCLTRLMIEKFGPFKQQPKAAFDANRWGQNVYSDNTSIESPSVCPTAFWHRVERSDSDHLKFRFWIWFAFQKLSNENPPTSQLPAHNALTPSGVPKKIRRIKDQNRSCGRCKAMNKSVCQSVLRQCAGTSGIWPNRSSQHQWISARKSCVSKIRKLAFIQMILISFWFHSVNTNDNLSHFALALASAALFVYAALANLIAALIVISNACALLIVLAIHLTFLFVIAGDRAIIIWPEVLAQNSPERLAFLDVELNFRTLLAINLIIRKQTTTAPGHPLIKSQLLARSASQSQAIWKVQKKFTPSFCWIQAISRTFSRTINDHRWIVDNNDTGEARANESAVADTMETHSLLIHSVCSIGRSSCLIFANESTWRFDRTG